jgi:hypothetical protein
MNMNESTIVLPAYRQSHNYSIQEVYIPTILQNQHHYHYHHHHDVQVSLLDRFLWNAGCCNAVFRCCWCRQVQLNRTVFSVRIIIDRKNGWFEVKMIVGIQAREVQAHYATMQASRRENDKRRCQERRDEKRKQRFERINNNNLKLYINQYIDEDLSKGYITQQDYNAILLHYMLAY